MSIISDAKLDFWIANNYNVLMKGKHGVGKTSAIIQAFERNGLRWKYFSASTLDPWVDLIGVPKERMGDNGIAYLDLVRPMEMANDEIDIIFFDEFNRCIAGDTKIPLASGECVAIKDLVNRDEFFVYAYDKNDSKIKIARGHSARKTVKNEKLLKITLDNGAYFKCTIDHPILNFDGNFVRADALTVGQSLLPLYRIWDNSKKTTNGYEMVWQPKKHSKWELTYHLADQYNLRNNVYTETKHQHRHHVDFTKYNNNPTNILRMSELEHIQIHATNPLASSLAGQRTHVIHPDLVSRTIGTIDSKVKALNNSLETRKKKPYKLLRSKISKEMYTAEMRKHRSGITSTQWTSGQFSKIDRIAALRKNHVMRTYNRLCTTEINLLSFSESDYLQTKKYLNDAGISILSVEKIMEWFPSFDAFANNISTIHTTKTTNNHKITSIEEVNNEDVYDITVDEYHNFAIECGIFVHNSPKKVKNAVMELMQFKSINGKKFNNLKMVWAAINPSEVADGEQSYDVEKMDPAQEDRFHIIINIPYEADLDYFKTKHNENGKIAVEWWGNLPEASKNLISPRRLDYLLDIYKNGGDIRDALDNRAVNVTQLIQQLKNGSYTTQLQVCYDNKDDVSAKKYMSNDNFYSACIKNIIKNEQYCVYFSKFMTKERLSQNIRNEKVRRLLMNALDYNDFKDSLDPLLAQHKTEKDKLLIKQLNSWKMSSPSYNANSLNTDETRFLKEIKALSEVQNTNYNKKLIDMIRDEFNISYNVTTCDKVLSYVINVLYSSHQATIKAWESTYIEIFQRITSSFRKHGRGGFNDVKASIVAIYCNSTYTTSSRIDKVNEFIDKITPFMNLI